jgi:hypothetical protein
MGVLARLLWAAPLAEGTAVRLAAAAEDPDREVGPAPPGTRGRIVAVFDGRVREATRWESGISYDVEVDDPRYPEVDGRTMRVRNAAVERDDAAGG